MRQKGPRSALNLNLKQIAKLHTQLRFRAKDSHWLGNRSWVKVGEDKLGTRRLAWAMFVGPLEAGERVLADCDERLCVNPEHCSVWKDGVKERDWSDYE